LSRVHKKEEEEEEKDDEGGRTRFGAWRRDRGGWTEGWLAVSE